MGAGAGRACAVARRRGTSGGRALRCRWSTHVHEKNALTIPMPHSPGRLRVGVGLGLGLGLGLG
eukprot:scaffold16305_cov66-Phaeocystis_antarctica.AAC.1